jgi:vacuolar-type H+-ATPase subunit I/STV1
MLSLILFLIIVWIAIGIIGAVVHGLIWLTIIAAVLFVGTLFFGGSHFGKRRSST